MQNQASHNNQSSGFAIGVPMGNTGAMNGSNSGFNKNARDTFASSQFGPGMNSQENKQRQSGVDFNSLYSKRCQYATVNDSFARKDNTQGQIIQQQKDFNMHGQFKQTGYNFGNSQYMDRKQRNELESKIGASNFT